MSAVAVDLPNNPFVETDALFKAIAHPARRRILTLLAVSDQSVKQLTSAFAMSQPAISQHLRELREARLVISHRVGTEQRYRLTGAPLKTVFDWCIPYRRFFDPAGHSWAFAETGESEAGDATAPMSGKAGQRDGR